MAASPEALDRLLLEAAELRKLKHPNLLHLFAVVADQPRGEVGLISDKSPKSPSYPSPPSSELGLISELYP